MARPGVSDQLAVAGVAGGLRAIGDADLVEEMAEGAGCAPVQLDVHERARHEDQGRALAEHGVSDVVSVACRDVLDRRRVHCRRNSTPKLRRPGSTPGLRLSFGGLAQVDDLESGRVRPGRLDLADSVEARRAGDEHLDHPPWPLRVGAQCLQLSFALADGRGLVFRGDEVDGERVLAARRDGKGRLRDAQTARGWGTTVRGAERDYGADGERGAAGQGDVLRFDPLPGARDCPTDCEVHLFVLSWRLLALQPWGG